MVSSRRKGWQPNKIVGLKVYTVYNMPEMFYDFYDENNRKISYAKDFLTFDIETTTINKDLNFMYIWMFSVSNKYIVYGRTWDEFEIFIDKLFSTLDDNERIICYVHNLSYEFQYLRGIHNFTKNDVFIMQSRKILKAIWDKIEFRCSYFLSNMSLSAWCHKLNVEEKKRSGEEFDYRKIRYPWTEISYEEYEYCFVDVISLYQCVEKALKLENDDLLTIPLTSTGYVRRDCKSALKRKRGYLHSIFPDKEQMLLLRQAFRGGNCHLSRFYCGLLINDVYSYDRQSSYPDNINNDIYPISKFVKESPTQLKLNSLIKSNRPILVSLCLADIELKEKWWGFPYIPIAKSRSIKNAIKDNGRILSADYLEITLTDIDYKIICQEYNFKIVEIKSLYSSVYGILPKELRVTMLEYYKYKTELKGVKGKEELYTKSKNKLNAIYGMMVQNPIKENIIYDDFEFCIDEEDTLEMKMAKYQKDGFLPYQWGVWTTAWSRWRLEEGLRIAGESAVYCDTDSVKCVKEINFDEFNSARIARDELTDGCAIDPRGKIQYLGIFDYEGKYDKFVSLGAKKYVVEIDGKLTITIAGVGKIAGGKELEELGGIECFNTGLIFRAGAAMEWRYNDDLTHTITIDGQKIVVTPNVATTPSTYEVSMSRDYDALIHDIIRYEQYEKIYK